MAKNSKTPFHRYLKEIFDEIYSAHIYYSIYWTLRNDQDRRKFVDVMHEYVGFFSPVITASFSGMVMALSKVFDDKNISIYTTLAKIRQSGRLHAPVVEVLQERIREIEPIVKKVLIPRDCVYAHISAKLDTAAAFKKAQISPDDFKHAIESTLKIWQLMNGMTEQVSSVLLDESFQEDTRRLLVDLKNTQPTSPVPVS